MVGQFHRYLRHDHSGHGRYYRIPGTDYGYVFNCQASDGPWLCASLSCVSHGYAWRGTGLHPRRQLGTFFRLRLGNDGFSNLW